eukprot:Selendium_serpulae@DN3162_c0_g1_i1.p1
MNKQILDFLAKQGADRAPYAQQEPQRRQSNAQQEPQRRQSNAQQEPQRQQSNATTDQDPRRQGNPLADGSKTTRPSIAVHKMKPDPVTMTSTEYDVLDLRQYNTSHSLYDGRQKVDPSSIIVTLVSRDSKQLWGVMGPFGAKRFIGKPVGVPGETHALITNSRGGDHLWSFVLRLLSVGFEFYGEESEARCRRLCSGEDVKSVLFRRARRPEQSGGPQF